ncbi:MAG: alkaline phosphatase family protein [Clostridia bacterium]|nr:alkaline phosphatase family protein [Clostridia bacterium]
MEKRKIALIVITCIIIASIIVSIGVSLWGMDFMAKHLPERYSDGIIPTSADVANAVKYDRVVIFGIDGMGIKFKDLDSPNFDKIFKDGSISYAVTTQLPSTSAHNWVSMFTGVRYQKHRIANSDAATRPYTSIEYPTIFKTYLNRHPNDKCLSIASWIPINYGCIENMDNMIKYVDKESKDEYHIEQDDFCVAKFKEVFKEVDPKITYIHFDNVDETGHKKGTDEEYEEAIKQADARMGEMYDYLEANNLVHGTLFICVSDHGHKKGGGHGGEDPLEKTATCAVYGDLGNIIKGTPGKMVTQDIASIVLYALGEKQPSNFDGMLPFNMFNTL